MKLLALCVICGFLATSNIVQTTAEKDTDEFSDYSDLFGDAARGVEALVGNALDDSDSSESDSDDDDNSDSDKDNTSILDSLNEGYFADSDDDDDNDDDVDYDEEDEIIFDEIDSVFSGTLSKLEAIGEEAVNEFLKGLQDLIGAVFDGNVIIENETLEPGMQNSNSPNVQEPNLTQQLTNAGMDTTNNNNPIEIEENMENESTTEENAQNTSTNDDSDLGGNENETKDNTSDTLTEDDKTTDEDNNKSTKEEDDENRPIEANGNTASEKQTEPTENKITETDGGDGGS